MGLASPSRAILTRRRSKQHLSVVCAAIFCMLGVAACGSSNKPNSASTSGSTSMLKYSECVRSHGVPDFPDPSTHQGPNAMGIDGYDFNLPANLNLQSPAYESASKACGHLIGTGSGAHLIVPARATEAALAHAECMRRHGVPNFPDPKVSANSQGITVGEGGPGMNPRSPAFQKAQKICQPS